MKRAIFIDANIYLRFYDSNSKEFKRLLESLIEIKNYILITAQIRDEVKRNKLNVFFSPFARYIKQFELSLITLPEHLEAATDEKLKNWNTTTQNLVNKVNDQKKELKALTEHLVRNILESKDEVSQVLDEIFCLSKDHTADQFAKARQRKEVGNPPGKNNDPLGDQISWEQLIDHISGIDELWIISNDSDYVFEFNKKCYLHSFLSDELKMKNKSINILCFNTLSEALTSFNKTTEITTLPPEEDLKEITSEERRSNLFRSASVDAIGATAPSGSFESYWFGPLESALGYSPFGGIRGMQPFHPYLDQIACTKCGRSFPISAFESPEGFTYAECRECRNGYEEEPRDLK